MRDTTATLHSSSDGGLELLGIGLLEEHARRLATLLAGARRRRGRGRQHLQRLRGDARTLRDVYTALSDDAKHESVSPAAEWLLDNFHLITAAIRDIQHDLPASFSRRLPTVAADEFAGLPRIYALALELTRLSAGSLDAQRLHRFITAFQAVTPLTIGELWAWPSALKLALIEHFRVRAAILAEHRAQRRAADAVVRSLEAGPLTARLPATLHAAFVMRLLQRSREYGATAGALRQSLESALAESGSSVEEVIRSDGRHQATEQATMSNLFGSLRLISSFDWSEFFEGVSLVDQVLRRDPAGVYPRMDFASRDRYRHAVEEIADPTGDSQLHVALKAVERARQVGSQGPHLRGGHVGEHLIGNGRPDFERSMAARPRVGERLRRLVLRLAPVLYLGAIALGTAMLVGAALWFGALSGGSPPLLLLVALLTIVPASELTIQVLQRIISQLVPPRRLARIELDQVPLAARTMVIVPTLIDSVRDVTSLLAHLEVQALGNVDPHIHFAILSDFRDASTETLPQDREILDAARDGIDALNRKHGHGRSDRFFLFHRLRQWNEAEGRWMGWERKRGKIEEFNRLLRGATDTSFSVQRGDVSILPSVRYCITLDTDTTLPRDAARQLIGIIEHPLSRPRVDAAVGRVVEGYGILQPRISVTFASAAGSWFARLFSGHTGVDPYTTAVSDTYQDLFSEGVFTGKGLYDVDAFTAVLDGSVPENALLSHDLFEGLHARVALVSDVELVDEYPSSVLSHARRQHRWIRGDWQILLWLLPFVPTRHGLRRNRLSLIGRWQVLDNLRRSLVAPTLLGLAIAGWAILPGSHWFWTIAVLSVLASQLLPLAAQLVVGPTRAQSTPVFLRNLWHDTLVALGQAALGVTLLAFHAVDALHAIAVTIVRLVRRRRLLEWETAAMSASKTAGLTKGQAVRLFASQMRASPIVAVLAGTLVAWTNPRALMVATPFLLLWLTAPVVAYWLSVPVGPRVRPLAAHERQRLRRTARATWRYFEAFVTAADSWLPPDNYQEEGRDPKIARRTSPTNIGMGLLSTLAAHDLGYLTTDVMAERLDATLTALEGLERHHGHFLNWYDTSTGMPLAPRYISTVDSGNLAASLMALNQGLVGLTREGQSLQARLEGLSDSVDLLAEAAAAVHAATGTADVTIERLARSIGVTAREAIARADTAPQFAPLAEQLTSAWEAAPDAVRASDVGYWTAVVLDAMRTLVLPASVPNAVLQSLALRASHLADDMQFARLYDQRRRLFTIGYRLADADNAGGPDNAFYDLLASEARLASFVAIVKGDVPQHHWFYLGRLVTNVHGRATLMSWGGTMFEYLMPLLLMRSFAGTLLDQSCQSSVRRQLEYGRERGVPWGISESAHASVDRAGHYQYRAFGVPGLGFRRGLADELVIAPYATVLATLVDPVAASENLERLAQDGCFGRFGFYEAVDYRPRDAAPDGATVAETGSYRPAIVRAFFAHHQGMSLVALANVICHDVFVKRFHADPRVEATELLLQERVPREAIITEPRPADSAKLAPATPVLATRRFKSPHTTTPHTHFLSNGRYTTALTNTGGGFSTWRDLAVTRRRLDRTTDAGAHYLYLRDPWSGHVWSPTYQPVCEPPREFETTFELDKVSYRCRDGDFETLVQVAVSPEDDVDVRRLSIRNRGDRPREIEVTSYAEIVLGRPQDDVAHPAFGKLFIETEFDAPSAGLLFTRRPRGLDDAPVWAFHVLGVEGRLGGAVEWETDRARFLGRGRSPANPACLDGRALSGTTGAVLDPIAAIRDRVRLAPGAVVRITFATGVAGSREEATALARKYRDAGVAPRTFSMAFTHVHITLQHLGLTDDHAMLFERLASRVFGSDDSCISPDDIAQNRLGQSDLWRHGISGDDPLVLVRVNEATAVPHIRQLLQAQEYWRLKGLRADIVILNEHPADYLDEAHLALTELVHEPRWAMWNGVSGGIHLLRGASMPAAERQLLAAVARVVLSGELGSLAAQLDRPAPWLASSLESSRAQPTAPAAAVEPTPVPELTMQNGIAGFTTDGTEYVVVLDGDRETPLPWSNVLANPEFGTIVTASGSSFSWAGNSRENRLTSFANDPVADPTGEAIFVRDDDSREVWGATPGPLRRGADAGRWVVRHAAGVTRFEHAVAGMTQQLEVFVAPRDAVKIAMLTLTNTSETPRRLSVFGYAEWTLGPPSLGDRRFVVTEADAHTGALLARNAYNTEHADQVAFWRATEPVLSYTADRGEFIGRHRTLGAPVALRRETLSGRVGAGLDPCAALQIAVSIEPGRSRRFAFVLGHGRDRRSALELAARYASVSQCEAALEESERAWDSTLRAITVKTPDDSFDLIVNRWLAYQTLSCRLWARSGPYQPGGAFGFRDQLQDVLALLYTAPGIAREHLLRAASRQFVEGDVQHWWHPPSGRGTRTRCSDDLLWLPYAAAVYVARTGDAQVLDESAPFLDAPQLDADQAEAYQLPRVADETASLFDHCVRAIERATKYGAHGLPLIGSGDWNDGMNRVGHQGRGESVWLGWFLVVVLEEFAALCAARERGDLAERYRNEAQWLTGMLELSWDGGWYRRAYFDDGTPLGSALNDECKLDSLTQSWAVLSGRADPRRAQRGMHAVQAQLVRREAQIVLLLTPPFDRTPQDPGYIKGYLPGIRENGGQYTHAAMWTVLALARLGSGDDAMELFHMLNPINHTRTAEALERYRTEPYAVAADVYAHPMHEGRGGWTWYTGSSGWMYRAAIEGLLGFRRNGRTFSVDPCIPAMWPGFSMEWRFRGAQYHITVTNPEHRCRGVKSAELDGVAVDARAIEVRDDGRTHDVVIVLGRKST